jgi:hypothetical protein
VRPCGLAGDVAETASWPRPASPMRTWRADSAGQDAAFWKATRGLKSKKKCSLDYCFVAPRSRLIGMVGGGHAQLLTRQYQLMHN